MRSEKRIFLIKILDTLCRFVHDDLMVGHPSAQSFQNTPSLEYKVLEQLPTWPILCHQYITRAVSLTKCRFNLPSPKLPSSGLMEFYVSQMVCVCIYSLYKIVHYTCNVEYTTRCVALPSDSSRPLLGHKTRLTTCTVHTTPPLCRAC